MRIKTTVKIMFEDIFVEERDVSWSLTIVPSRKGVKLQAKLLTPSIKLPDLVDGELDYSKEINFPLNKFAGQSFYSKEQEELPAIALKTIYIDYETKSYSLYFEND